MTRYYLAQANFGRLRAPLESPIMEGFRTQLDPINTLADQSPGFVWRLKTEDGNSMAIRPYPGDDLMAMTMSVWESFELLQRFVYQGQHVATLRDRKQWFQHMEGPILVLWWIPAGQIPAVPDAVERLQYLKEHGPTARAFTFRSPFPAPGGGHDETKSLDAALCDWATPDTPPSA